MVKYIRLISVIAIIISLSSIYAQSEPERDSYWIYTTSSEMKNYQIVGFENDQLTLNNGSWDVSVSLDEVEMILDSPGPSPLGQIAGGAIGGYGGICIGFIAGSIIFGGGSEGEEGVLAVGIASVLAGAYYGSKAGGNFLKGQPEIIVDMTMWTVEEKKEYIQTNFIY